MDPRISFSSDFVDIQQAITVKHESVYRESPASSDFEFSVKNHAMISADEVFSQGMLVPNNRSMTSKKMTTTLRDELLVSDDLHDVDVSPRVTKSFSRWKERLGLRKSTSNKKDKKGCSTDGFLPRVAEEEESPIKDDLGLLHEGGQKKC